MECSAAKCEESRTLNDFTLIERERERVREMVLFQMMTEPNCFTD